MEAKILLKDGTLFSGKSDFPIESVFGEIVFNTGMTGYQEILTDPSYAGQIVVMTYPLIGNYGVNKDDTESDSVKPVGFVVKEFCKDASNWKSNASVTEYLRKNNTPAVYDVDTRMLTKKIRTTGAMNCVITTEEITDELKNKLEEFEFPKNIVSQVSMQKPHLIKGNGHKIALVDLGVKTGIVKQLSALGAQVEIFPWNTPAENILSSGCDAVLLSNGPGDPKDVKEVIKTAQNLLGRTTVFGICLGHQILALALGGDTYKMKFGHRGSNHPVIDLRTNKVQITAQNHGYAVNSDSLPTGATVTHININDATVEGFCAPQYKIQTVQFHPEAGPGPRDCSFIFRDWIEGLDNIQEDEGSYAKR